MPDSQISPEHERFLRRVGRTESMSAAVVRIKLEETARLARNNADRNPFFVDQVVTPRDDHGYANVGKPHVVIRTLKLERNRFGFGSPNFGKMADTWVAFLDETGNVTTAWVESYAFRSWNAETDGRAYDEVAEAAATKFAEQLAALNLAPEPTAPPPSAASDADALLESQLEDDENDGDEAGDDHE